MGVAAPSPYLCFDFADHTGRPRRLYFYDPCEVIVARSATEVRPALRRVQQAVDQGLYAAGYLSYEAAPAFDPALAVRPDAQLPLLWFGIFAAPHNAGSFSAQRHEGTEDSTGGVFRPSCTSGLVPPAPLTLSPWQPAIDRARYDAAIATVREAIGRGDTYQANYTLRLRAEIAGDDWALYEQLRAAQQADYGAYLDLGRWHLLSVSPELFFRWRDGQLVTRPMKGTVRRGRWLAEDQQRAAWLAASEKNRAENLMIVDLLRNDLGRIAEIGSVQVPALFAVERYPTLFQLTSTVSARTHPGTTLEDVFAALFPCGSITGTPKIETMKLLSRLEDSPREVYCGAIGMVSPEEALFNVAIRTVVVDTATGVAEYGVGGGITWDSTAAEEYAEALAKAALLTEPQPRVTLLETLRLEHGEYWLLEGHLRRLADSAHYFDLPLDQGLVLAALEALAAEYPDELRRVRLLLDRQGVALESMPLAALPPGPLPVTLAAGPVSRDDRMLYHKTTSRGIYEAARQGAPPGVFDVLLWNQQGELTEFCIGNLVAEIDGEQLTPPRECGLLGGVLRAELLAQGVIREQVLTCADLGRATQLWLINSLRGWVPCSLENRG